MEKMIKPEQWTNQSINYYILICKKGNLIVQLLRDPNCWHVFMGTSGETLPYSEDPPFEEAGILLAEHYNELVRWCKAYRSLTE